MGIVHVLYMRRCQPSDSAESPDFGGDTCQRGGLAVADAFTHVCVVDDHSAAAQAVDDEIPRGGWFEGRQCWVDCKVRVVDAPVGVDASGADAATVVVLFKSECAIDVRPASADAGHCGKCAECSHGRTSFMRSSSSLIRCSQSGSAARSGSARRMSMACAVARRMSVSEGSAPPAAA